MGSLFFLLAGVVAGESWGVLEGVSSRLLLFTVRFWGTLATRVSRAMCSSSRRWSPAITLRTKSTCAGRGRHYSSEYHNESMTGSKLGERWQVCTCWNLAWHESKMLPIQNMGLYTALWRAHWQRSYFAMNGGKENHTQLSYTNKTKRRLSFLVSWRGWEFCHFRGKAIWPSLFFFF